MQLNAPLAAAQPPTNEAITEIQVFARQMRQMTELVCQVQADMAEKLATANERMALAAEAVAAGEARIAARIAEFEKLSAASQAVVEAQQKALAAAAEKVRDNAMVLSQDLLAPLKDETAGIVKHIADSGIMIRAETAGLMTKVQDAAEAFNARAEGAIKLHTDRFAETVGNALLNGQSKLAQTSEALNAAAGALAQGILSTTERHDARAEAMAALAERIAAIGDVLPDAEALIEREAAAAAAAQRIEGAAQAVASISSGLAVAATQAQASLAAAAAAASQDRREAMAQTAAGQADAKASAVALAEAIEHGVARLATQRDETTVEILSRLDSLAESLLTNRAEPAKPAPQVLDAERDSMLRMTVSLRLVMRDIGRENGRLGELVDGLGGAVAALQQRLAAIEAQPPAVVAGPVIEHDIAALPPLDAEKNSLARLLAGFRLLLKDIGGEADRFRGAVSAIAARQAPEAPAPSSGTPAAREDADRVIAAIGALASRLEGIEAVLQRPDAPGPAAVHAAEKESLQRLLVGFRLLLQEINAGTEEYREKVAALPRPEPADLAPIEAAAERIGAGVAETLAAIELKLDEPLARLLDTAAESAGLLKAAHAAMAAPAKAARLAEPGGLPAPDALAEAVARMEGAAEMIDSRTAGLAQLTAQLKRGGAGDPALKALAADLASASETLRREAGDFLAISAALSRDIERVAGRASTAAETAPASPKSLKKRRAA